MTATLTQFGPTGQTVYERTYSRTKADGSKEKWPDTVQRVVDGNLALAPAAHLWPDERERLYDLIVNFKAIPAGRHLWASGVKGRQFLFNCHVSGFNENPSDHFRFSFLRLMEGGGVGANYSNHYLEQYPRIERTHTVHIVCDREHDDFLTLKDAGLISSEYDPDWPGAIEVEDSREGWADALGELLDTYYRSGVVHENRVFDVSRVRPEGARLKSFGGYASGPAPLAVMLQEVSSVLNRHRDEKLSGMGAMEIDHAIAQCVVSGGNRRSARMSLMHWSDPQIHEFLACKRDSGKHWTTNISVELDDSFYSALNISRKSAVRVLYSIAEGMLSGGEPGIWNSSYSNKGEPNQVIATNPCGEIALEAWENCNLGHVNLAAFVDNEGLQDYQGMKEAHRLMTRFLIRATYGDVTDSKQADVLARNRRIGVGHFGLASYAAKRGIPYSKIPYEREVQRTVGAMAGIVDEEAASYAHNLRIPVPVKKRTVAPTGTIAKMPGVSEGIHPVFAKYFLRRIRFSTIDPDQMATVQRYIEQGYHVEEAINESNTIIVEIPTKDTLLDEVASTYGEVNAEQIVESPADLDLIDMLGVQMMYQTFWADNAVSYTANIDPDRYSAEELAQAIAEYGRSLKGMTVFPELSRPQSPYERLTREQYETYSATAVADSIDEECISGACPVR